MGEILQKFALISAPWLLAGATLGVTSDDAEAKSTSARPAQTHKNTPAKAKPKATPARRQAASKPSSPPAATKPRQEDCNASDVSSRPRVAYFTNLNTGEVVFGAEDADKKFFQASVTKLATIYVALNLVQEGKLSLDQNITISRSGFTNSRGHVEQDLQFPNGVVSMKLKDLILLARMRSSNIAAHNIALAIERADGSGHSFAQITQRYTSQLGMTSTYSDDASSGTGFPTRRALSIQSTSGRNEALLLGGLSKFPEDLAWMNVTKATLEGQMANGKTKKIDIDTKIQSQLSNNPNFISSSIIKTGYGCQTGHAESGMVNLNGANIAFTLSGYASGIDRSSTRTRILAKIRREIAEGNIAINPVPQLVQQSEQETTQASSFTITFKDDAQLKNPDSPIQMPSRNVIAFLSAAGLIASMMIRQRFQANASNNDGKNPAFAPANAQNQQLNIV